MGGGMGLQIADDLLPDGFWARLTTPIENDNNPWYSFIEVQDDGTGQGWTTPGGAVEVPYAALEINGNTNIPVPGPPTNLYATLESGGSLSVGSGYYYVVTATWKDALNGDSYQSGLSAEVSATAESGQGSVTLTWNAPTAVDGNGYVLTGYSVWRGTSAGGENVLVASVGANTLTYTDTGGAGTSQSPTVGGEAGPIVWMSPLAVQGYYKFSYPKFPELPWVKVTSAAAQTIALPGSRSVSDASTTQNSTTLTSTSANFTSGDVGASIGGAGIPSGTTITSVTDSSHAVLSAAATATATNVSAVIGPQLQGYTAAVEDWDGKTTNGKLPAWTDQSPSVWFVPINGEKPVSGSIYQCRLLGADASGVAIWAAASFPTNLPSLADVTLTTIPHTPPTITMADGSTKNGYSGTYTNAGSSAAACWLLADLNSLFLVASYPTGPITPWTPPRSGWVYQARWTGQWDANNVPIFQLAGWHAAGWQDNNDGTYTVYAGLVGFGSGATFSNGQYLPGVFQILPGDKQIAGNLKVGTSFSGNAAGVGGTVDCAVLDANGPAQQGGSNIVPDNAAPAGALVTTINSAGNIGIGGIYKGILAFCANGQWPTTSAFSPIPDTQFVALAAEWSGFGTGATVLVGTESIVFSGGGVNQPSLFIGGAGQWLDGMTGSLGDGSQVVSGLVVSAGGQPGGLTIDGGSFWD